MTLLIRGFGQAPHRAGKPRGVEDKFTGRAGAEDVAEEGRLGDLLLRVAVRPGGLPGGPAGWGPVSIPGEHMGRVGGDLLGCRLRDRAQGRTSRHPIHTPEIPGWFLSVSEP